LDRSAIDQMKKPAEAEAATLSVDQAWAIVGTEVISRSSFYFGVRSGDIPHVRVGRRILIPRNAFNRWLEEAGLNRGTAA
jgi:excisionase family DNA binding protein